MDLIFAIDSTEVFRFLPDMPIFSYLNKRLPVCNNGAEVFIDYRFFITLQPAVLIISTISPIAPRYWPLAASNRIIDGFASDTMIDLLMDCEKRKGAKVSSFVAIVMQKISRMSDERHLAL